MSFVPIKGVEQQGLSMLHSARSQLIGQRTQLINAVRGHLSELGIVAQRGLLGLAELAEIVRDERDEPLTSTARAALMILVRQIETLSIEIIVLDSELSKENKASELGPRLETIPSVGPVIAGNELARCRLGGGELPEIPHLPASGAFRNCHRITRFRRIDCDESFAMMPHDSPSMYEALPGRSGQPSTLHRG